MAPYSSPTTGRAGKLRLDFNENTAGCLDHVKIISVQEVSGKALASLAPAITTLARAEGLEAHARSVEVRLA
jgi:histidinol dehydrogenase